MPACLTYGITSAGLLYGSELLRKSTVLLLQLSDHLVSGVLVDHGLVFDTFGSENKTSFRSNLPQKESPSDT